jgi:hypothetical protein
MLIKYAPKKSAIIMHARFHVKSSTQQQLTIDSLSSRKYKHIRINNDLPSTLSIVFSHFFGKKKRDDIHTSNGIYIILCLFQVRKERLGDRITALHQIVSPFGKVQQLTN